MKTCHITDFLYHNGFPCGRMISGSKSFYTRRHPDNFVLFNANIISKNVGEKVWYGDLDLTEDFDKLKELSEEMSDEFYFLYEMDARFEESKKTIAEYIAKSKWDTTKNIAPIYKDHF